MASLDVGQNPTTGYGDAVMLDKVSEQSFLENLKIRFENGRIYTYIGEVNVNGAFFKRILHADAVCCLE